MKKRAQGLSMNVIIILILALMCLVMLVLTIYQNQHKFNPETDVCTKFECTFQSYDSFGERIQHTIDISGQCKPEFGYELVNKKCIDSRPKTYCELNASDCIEGRQKTYCEKNMNDVENCVCQEYKTENISYCNGEKVTYHSKAYNFKKNISIEGSIACREDERNTEVMRCEICFNNNEVIINKTCISAREKTSLEKFHDAHPECKIQGDKCVWRINETMQAGEISSIEHKTGDVSNYDYFVVHGKYTEDEKAFYNIIRYSGVSYFEARLRTTILMGMSWESCRTWTLVPKKYLPEYDENGSLIYTTEIVPDVLNDNNYKYEDDQYYKKDDSACKPVTIELKFVKHG